MAEGPVLTQDEVAALAGGYTRPADQLRYLRRRGFWRADRSPKTGLVILERAHYEAVCRSDGAANDPNLGPRPQVRPRRKA